MRQKSNILLICLFIGVILYGCKSVEYLPSEKEYVYVNKTDTLVNYDSIYIHDSIFSYIKSDTVFVEKFKDVYKNKYIYINKIDTVFKDKNIVEVKTIERKEKWYEKALKWAGIAFILIICYYIYRLIKKKIYKRLW